MQGLEKGAESDRIPSRLFFPYLTVVIPTTVGIMDRQITCMKYTPLAEFLGGWRHGQKRKRPLRYSTIWPLIQLPKINEVFSVAECRLVKAEVSSYLEGH